MEIKMFLCNYCFNLLSRLNHRFYEVTNKSVEFRECEMCKKKEPTNQYALTQKEIMELNEKLTEKLNKMGIS